MSRDPADSAAETNPFSAQRVRPGAIAYRFPPDADGEALVARLAREDWWGQIIGRHGSGKSTLLAALVPLIEQHGCKTLLVELHDGQHRLPVDPDRIRLPARGVVIVDGYEQLSRWNRLRLKRACRSRALGLLVTAHRTVGMPTLYQTRTDVELVRALVAELLGPTEGALFTADEVQAIFDRRHGDLREAFFALYDLYEQRRPSLVVPPSGGREAEPG